MVYIKQLEFYYFTQEDRKTKAGVIPTKEQLSSTPASFSLLTRSPNRTATEKVPSHMPPSKGDDDEEA